MKRDFFSTFKYPLLILAVITLIAGGYSFTKMKVALFPEITFPKIKVIVDAGQRPVSQMAVSVTRPLENAIKQVPDLATIRSTTSRGSCEISAFMNWSADIDLSKQQIESRINEIRNQLPADASISVEKMNPSILPVMGYSLTSNKLNPIALKQLALYTIKPYLSQVAGVSDVRIIGGQDKEYWIQLNQVKMSALGITPQLVAQSFSSTNFILSNGYLSDYRSMYLTLTDAQLTSMQQIESMVVKGSGKRVVQLRDIADVMIHPAKQYIKVNANGKESILIAIVKQPSANVVELSRAMQAKISQLKKILPKGVQIRSYYNQADFVNNTVHSVMDCLWIGLLLAVIVAVIFLKSLKPSITLLLTLPLTLSLTLIVLKLTGQDLNIMTLGALAAATGLIIDDAIVVVEQIQRFHEQSENQPAGSVAREAIRYLFKAMLGSSISTVVIFIPFVLMSGVAGAYFKVMTSTMIITLICSFFITWIFLPVIYLILSTSNKVVSNYIPSHPVQEKKWVRFFIHRPVYSIIFLIILIGSIILVIPHLSTGFLPQMDEGSVVLDYASPPGTTLEETDRMLHQIEKIITANPSVEAYSRRTGTQLGFFITEPNTGDYLIQLKKNRSVTTDEVINSLRQQIEATQPALRVDFGQVMGDMLGDLMESAQPIEIKVFGSDQKVIQQYSRQIAAILNSVKGTADVFDGITIAGPSLMVHPDFMRLSQYGITPTDFQFQLQNGLEGNEVGSVFDPLQLTPVRLVYPGNSNMSLSAIRNQEIFLPGGQRKPFSEFADFSITGGVAEQQRENLQNMGTVGARLENRDLGSTMQELQNRIDKEVNLPPGYSIAYGGAYAAQQKSFTELALILGLSSLLVFTTILFLFKDIRVALIILMLSVLGIAGSYLLLYLTNTPLNVGSYTGIIMIVGIIGENAIFTYTQFKASLKEMSKEHSIIYAISTRLRPKLMTAIGAIIALMPLALGIGTGAQLHQPLAIAVIGGFLVALPLLLIVFPTMLNLIGGKEKQGDRNLI
ncbi:heavy metal efflux pump, CzcA family [Arachidicoccus rhizosphaerae]|uniref:Heavy metal efflux pump, CzcA family n=1 Tax=Arachidicoccus rhizosphaerae TaxID=551991 RepID=A0A1H4BHH0_9BACT|nr:efflux RND transporter permease subunit [Arachidicoccus rhizosphaerae]SEA47619.1 heavy metal efflux pump, CzcA family [Arachidicoccus rhizosphaerae]